MKLYIAAILTIGMAGILTFGDLDTAVKAQSSPVDAPGETIYVQNLSEEKSVILSVPFFVKNFVFRVEEKKPPPEEIENLAAKLIGGSYIEIAAEKKDGGVARSIPDGVRIAIRIPQIADRDVSKIGLYALRGDQEVWELIPSAKFNGDVVEFETEILSVFAVFETPSKAPKIQMSFPFVSEAHPLFDVGVSYGAEQESKKRTTTVAVMVVVMVGATVGAAAYIYRRKKYAH